MKFLEIIPNIYLGDVNAAKHLETNLGINGTEISLIISLNNYTPKTFRKSIVYRKYDLKNPDEEALSELLCKIINYKLHNCNILFHCTFGQCRSVSFIWLFISLYLNIPLNDFEYLLNRKSTDYSILEFVEDTDSYLKNNGEVYKGIVEEFKLNEYFKKMNLKDLEYIKDFIK